MGGAELVVMRTLAFALRAAGRTAVVEYADLEEVDRQ